MVERGLLYGFIPETDMIEICDMVDTRGETAGMNRLAGKKLPDVTSQMEKIAITEEATNTVDVVRSQEKGETSQDGGEISQDGGETSQGDGETSQGGGETSQDGGETSQDGGETSQDGGEEKRLPAHQEVLKCGTWNCRGFTTKEITRFNFRKAVVTWAQCDILGLCETFLKEDEEIIIDGYTWFGNNRKDAKKASGGVGFLIKKEHIGTRFNVTILDKSTEGILWIQLKGVKWSMCFAMCYLTPKRPVTPEAFFYKLLKKVYEYQNLGQTYILGDFNAHCGNLKDFIDGVDNVIPRDVIHFNSDPYGNRFLNFLTQSSFIMLNGRIGEQDFTCVTYKKTKGSVVDFTRIKSRSVIDYVCVPQEELSSITSFEVLTMDKFVKYFKREQICVVPKSIPDHSFIIWQSRIEEEQHETRTIYDLTTIPEDFLTDDATTERVKAVIERLTAKQLRLWLHQHASRALGALCMEFPDGCNLSCTAFIELYMSRIAPILCYCKDKKDSKTLYSGIEKIARGIYNRRFDKSKHFGCL